MALHENKFEFLAYRTPSSKILEELPFTAQWLRYNTRLGRDIYSATNIKGLGFHLSPDMKWPAQKNLAAQSANKMAN